MKPLEEVIDLDRLNYFLDGVDYRGPNGCWLWTRGKKEKGYGEFKPFLGPDKNNRATHAIMWEIRNGAVPEGLVLDHIVCDNPPCCNPAHLTPTTLGKNLTRTGPAAVNRAKTHCGTCGGEYDYIRPGRDRGCRRCRTEATRRYRARKKGQS